MSDEDFGRFLALAVAIRRRDEVAVKQFATKIATELVEEFEVQEALKNTLIRNAEDVAAKKRSSRSRCGLHDAAGSLVDKDGMAWLRKQIAGRFSNPWGIRSSGPCRTTPQFPQLARRGVTAQPR